MRASRPCLLWIPAFAGMTKLRDGLPSRESRTDALLTKDGRPTVSDGPAATSSVCR